MNADDIPLSFFEVDCDGSACGSGDVQRHVHPPQHGGFLGLGGLGRVTVRNGKRVLYEAAQGITRMIYLDENGRPDEDS